MAKCAFCGQTLQKGTGTLFVYKSGKTDWFCSRKCEKNLLMLNRKPLQTRWSDLYKKADEIVEEKKSE